MQVAGWNDNVVTGYTDISLNEGTTYWFRLRSYNNEMVVNDINLGNVINLRTLPAASTTFDAVEITTSSIMWGWVDSSVGEDGYEIYTGTGGLKTRLDRDTMSWLETRLLPNTQYVRRGRVYNKSGGNLLNSATVYTLSWSPVNLMSTGNTVDSVTISWSGSNVSGYVIERSIDVGSGPESWDRIVNVSDNYTQTSYTDTSLQQDITYWYRVYSYNVDKRINPVPSNYVQSKTVVRCPTIFAAVVLTSGSIVWQWNDVPGEDGYRVCNRELTDPIKELGSGATYWVETGLLPNTRYERYVEAYNVSGASSTFSVLIYTFAEPPAGLTSLVQTAATINLSWTGNASRYQVDRLEDNNGNPGTVLMQSSTTGTSYTDIGLIKDKYYWYRIYAYNNDNKKNNTPAEIRVKTMLDDTPPTGTPITPVVSGLPATGPYLSKSTVTFTWAIGSSADPESGIVGYHLRVGTFPGGAGVFDSDVGNVVAYDITGCIDGKTYYSNVCAKNGAGLYGTWSSTSTGVLIDLTPPGYPSIRSHSHPDQETEWADDNAVFITTGPEDSSGIDGYYYLFNTDSTTVPGYASGEFVSANSTGTILSFPGKNDGHWYLHIIAKDKAGNISTWVIRYKVKIKKNIDPGNDNVFKVPDGTVVQIPAGSVSVSVKIIIRTPVADELKKVVHDSQIRETNVVKEISLSDMVTLLKDIIITLTYTDNDIPASSFDRTKLKLAYYDEKDAVWKPMLNSESTPADKKVSVSVNHLTKFRIMEYKISSEEISGLSNYPNPFSAGAGKTTKLRYTLKEDSEVEIKIYDLLGDLVWQRKINPGEIGGQTGPNEVYWDGKNERGSYVAVSGYLCYVKTKNKLLKTKIAVR
jgi:hypothetical protein